MSRICTVLRARPLLDWAGGPHRPARGAFSGRPRPARMRSREPLPLPPRLRTSGRWTRAVRTRSATASPWGPVLDAGAHRANLPACDGRSSAAPGQVGGLKSARRPGGAGRSTRKARAAVPHHHPPDSVRRRGSRSPPADSSATSQDPVLRRHHARASHWISSPGWAALVPGPRADLTRHHGVSGPEDSARAPGEPAR